MASPATPQKARRGDSRQRHRAGGTVHDLSTPVPSRLSGIILLLITDPISNDDGGRSEVANVEGTMFEQLARNTTSNDIPTLIEVLQSPVLLQPVADKFEVSTGALRSRVDIKTGGAKRKEAEGVLNVSLTGRNPIEDERLLKALSSTYLQAALQQRQQRLADGLAFLNKQAPSLQTRLDQLQGELADFRTRYSLLEPTAEGGALKQRENRHGCPGAGTGS